MTISNRVSSLGSYVFSQPKRTEKSGLILDLGAGNPTLPPSAKMINHLQKLAGDPQNYRYPGYKAIPELFGALRNFYEQKFNFELREENVLPLLGAKDGVNAINLALADLGDEVLVPDPGYPAYSSLAKLHGLKSVAYVLSEKNFFQLEVEKLDKLKTAKTKFIWVNFPSNPTGQIPSPVVLKKLVGWCLKNKVWLIFDNAYLSLRFDGQPSFSILQIEGAEKIAVEICSLSKSHSLAGLRIGWMVGNARVIDAVSQVKSQMDSGLSLLWQKMLARALTDDDLNWQQTLIKSYQSSRELTLQLMNKLGLECELPPASLYLWIKVPTGFADGRALADFLLQEKRIIVTPGRAFGQSGEKYVRISVTADPKLIKEFL